MFNGGRLIGRAKLGTTSPTWILARTLTYSRIELPPSDASKRPPPLLEVPDSIQRPSYASTGTPPIKTRAVPKYSDAEVAGIRSACQLAREVLEYSKTLVQPGITTAELDRLIHERIISAGAYPSPLNYMGFPKSVTTSVNNVVCHGIPDDRALEATDLINVDVSVYSNGFHGDCSATVGLPDLDAEGTKLLEVAHTALDVGVDAARVGSRVSAIGKAIDASVTAAGYTVCHEFIGHGIGYDFHTAPDVFPYDTGVLGLVEPQIEPGMVFTIEPAVNEKGREISILHDGWTAITQDGFRSAQFEHTVHITEDGHPEILTII